MYGIRGEKFQVNPGFTCLDLGENKLIDEGVMVLAEALKVDTPLTTVLFNHNRVGPPAAIALAHSLVCCLLL